MAESRYAKQYNAYQPLPSNFMSAKYRIGRSSEEGSNSESSENSLESDEPIVGMARSPIYTSDYQSNYAPQYPHAQHSCGSQLLIGCQPVVRTIPCSSYHQHSYRGDSTYNVPSYGSSVPAYQPTYYVASPQSSYRDNEKNKTEKKQGSTTAKTKKQ